ncbi:Superfamily II DNA or RNA helicase [Psychrobacillus sp. OK028]|uniref:DEAD/DEAH box helicase family protein n=1 Tax=Psychrobacillus sp. OK028 TaxID=1884359 RepID=UPI00087EB93E|nr:DEAD/DEAH box helicase family protein [Psychrobacillus sp. OK028]SDN76269.1 Superfamily II DNA or RNA helicase [Psychrobacillus sp. OK028]
MSKLRLITSNLIQDLTKLSADATSIYWVTAFAMKSGVKLVLPALKEALARNTELKILVGDYLYITQPQALELLLKELPGAEIRLHKSSGISFHPKAYLFRSEINNHLIVGSSNLSASALQRGVEWNLYAPAEVSGLVFEEATDEFMKLFYSDSTISLNKETLETYASAYEQANLTVPLSQKWTESEEQEVMFGPIVTESKIHEQPEPYITEPTELTPRPAQVMALDALQETMQDEYDKALVVLATGLGKTYLAAFFAEQFERVLFIAHREEILNQAKASFLHVHPEKKAGLYNAIEKNKDADFVFASIHTLTQKFHLEQFNPQAFDLIVIDEFHHAAAPSYERVLEHFKPKFLLGITATPDRLDNKDVYSICDGNIAIRIHFIDAIQRNWLSPFHYYGVYDDTDYSQIRWLGTGYDEEELSRVQLREEMAEKILQAWIERKQTRTIGFCSTVRQAKFLSNYFEKAGYRSIALSGTTPRNNRMSARKQLESGQLDIIFTVDLFNEGVDIPTVDTLLFARPTESITVFTQQIGRGLRLAKEKSYCVIIDLIGNYRNADTKLTVFTPDSTDKAPLNIIQTSLPGQCVFNLETEIIDLVKEMARKVASHKQRLIYEYFRLKEEMGTRPSYLEYHLKSGIIATNVKKEFGSYVGMLKEAGELNEQELEAFELYKDWLEEVEKTAMSKSYKMVLLKYMLSRGVNHWHEPVKAEEVAPFFAEYLTAKEYRRKIDVIDTDLKKVASLIERMPMTKWSGSSKGKITFENGVLKLNFNVMESVNDIVFEWTKEICEFRLHWYFGKKGEKI